MVESQQNDHGKTDAEMSMAIDNLCAILNTQDVDQVIELLQSNNWDEANAAQAYYANQAQNMPREEQRPPQLDTEGDEEVRQPMQFQEEQLIGSPDERMGLLGITPDMVRAVQMRQQQQQARMLGETPTMGGRGGHAYLRGQQPVNVRMPKFTFENMADSEEEKNQPEPERRSLFRRAINGMGYVLSSIFWCNDREEDELINHERNSMQVLQKFRTDSMQNYRVISGNQELRFDLWDDSISKLCITSLRRKRPILTLVLREGTPEDFRSGLTAFTRTESANELIRNSFLFTGFDMANPPLPAFETLIQLPENCNAVLYFSVVTHEMKVQLMKKLVLMEQTETQDLYNFLMESKNLFEIMAEEDPAYQRVEMLTNAGLIPPQQTMGGSHVRQPDPDALLRQQQKAEYEAAQQADIIRQIEKREAEERAKQEEYKRQSEMIEKENEEELEKALAFERIERKNTIKSSLPAEPEEGSPDAATIVFRAPGSGKRFQRRFLKTDSVKLLYDYVRTLEEDDLGFDDPSNEFNLIQPMPRKVFEEDESKSIEVAGLFPRALLQIQENQD